MVFSRLAHRRDYGMGVALLVPCRASVTTVEDLIEEARHLWSAETSDGDGKGRIGSGWGRVSALFRDKSNTLLPQWTGAVSSMNFESMPSTASEGPAAGTDGLLRIRWPMSVDQPGDGGRGYPPSYGDSPNSPERPLSIFP